MVYKINYDGNKEDVKKAYDNCEKVMLDVANALMAKFVTKTMTIDELKEYVTNTIKLARNLGALDVYMNIVEGKFEGDDADE